MALVLFDPAEHESECERILIYADPGIGKTRFALSLTERFKEIIYFAADDNAKFLSSLSKEKRARVRVIDTQGDNILENFQQFCEENWKEKFPNAKTLVVDTYSIVVNEALRHSANSKAITNEKHYVLGDPSKGGQVIPNRGDTYGVESLSRGYLDTIFDKQRDMNIIFICHMDVRDIEGVKCGGPAHPGRKMITELPARFSTVIRLDRDSILVPGAESPENVVVAITEGDGKFIAKLRTTDENRPNPLARVVLDRNPVNFWKAYDALFYTNKEEVNV